MSGVTWVAVASWGQYRSQAFPRCPPATLRNRCPCHSWACCWARLDTELCSVLSMEFVDADGLYINAIQTKSTRSKTFSKMDSAQLHSDFSKYIHIPAYGWSYRNSWAAGQPCTTLKFLIIFDNFCFYYLYLYETSTIDHSGPFHVGIACHLVRIAWPSPNEDLHAPMEALSVSPWQVPPARWPTPNPLRLYLRHYVQGTLNSACGINKDNIDNSSYLAYGLERLLPLRQHCSAARNIFINNTNNEEPLAVLVRDRW